MIHYPSEYSWSLIVARMNFFAEQWITRYHEMNKKEMKFNKKF